MNLIHKILAHTLQHTHTRLSTGNASLLFLLAPATTTTRRRTTLASEIEKQPKTNNKFKWGKLCAKNVKKIKIKNEEEKTEINKLKVALKI